MTVVITAVSSFMEKNADAFSALNLAVPVESIVTGFIMLTTGGAGIIASRRIGGQNTIYLSFAK